MRIVFAGTPAVAAETLGALLDDGRHEVVGVLTRPDAPQGRSGRPVPSAVARLAQERGIETWKPSALHDPAFRDRLAALAPECCVVVAYGALVPSELLDRTWINVHYSLLPRWRGAAPVQRAIMAGDEVTGVSVFRLVAELDAGPVFAQVPEPVGDRDAGELLAALTDVGAEALLATLDALEQGRATPVEQPADGVTYAAKLTPADARLDWTRPAAEIVRTIRACSPAPGAWTLAGEERVGVLGAETAETSALAPGVVQPGKREVLVGTGNGDVRLTRVQPQGRRAMPAADWGRGLRAAPVFS